MHTLKKWNLPQAAADITPTITVPDPTIQLGSTGTEVKELQMEMTFWGWYKAAVDGSCGPVTVDGIKKLQAALKLVTDGVYGPLTATAYKKWKTQIANL